jgi:hypothetical protein
MSGLPPLFGAFRSGDVGATILEVHPPELAHPGRQVRGTLVVPVVDPGAAAGYLVPPGAVRKAATASRAT